MEDKNNFLKDLEIVDPRASFTKIHVIKVLLLLKDGAMGRPKIIERSGLSEASVRTLLNNLVENEILEPSTKGHLLTEKGKELMEKINKKINGPIKLGNVDLTVAENNVAFSVKNNFQKNIDGLKQRDASIKAGGKGATTLVYKKNKFWIRDEEVNVPEKLKELNLTNGDIIIIGSALNSNKAEEGAIAAVLSLF